MEVGPRHVHSLRLIRRRHESDKKRMEGWALDFGNGLFHPARGPESQTHVREWLPSPEMDAHPRGGLPRIRTVSPADVRIQDVVVVPRVIHQDARGFLVEALRKDDGAVLGDQFAMSYTSVTVPGAKRDEDRWHVHRHQQDRIVVPSGEMVLALYDARGASTTRGSLVVVRMAGTPTSAPSTRGKKDMVTHMVTVPEGVYHCIGNLHPTDPCIHQNFPTRLFDPQDEGRVMFVKTPVESLGGRLFSWDLVEVVR